MLSSVSWWSKGYHRLWCQQAVLEGSARYWARFFILYLFLLLLLPFMSSHFFILNFFLTFEIRIFLPYVEILLVSGFHLFFLFFFLATPLGMWDLGSLTRDQTCPLQWNRRVLTTGPPGNSPEFHLLIMPSLTCVWIHVTFQKNV